MRLTYRHLTILPEEPARVLPERPMTVCRQCAGYLAEFFSELYAVHGLVVMARQGWALGAYREGGAIGHDDDADVFLVRPAGCPQRELLSRLRAAIAAWNGRHADRPLSLTTFAALVLVYREYSELILSFPFGGLRPYFADVNVVYEEALFQDEVYNAFSERRYGLRPDALFHTLQRWAFEGTTVFGFAAPTMEVYLQYLYGADFMIPQHKIGREVNFRNRRALWRTAPGNALFNFLTDNNVIYDVFERRRWPRFNKDAP